MVSRWRFAAVAGLLVSGALAAAANAQEHILVPGQSASGLVEQAGEVDEVRFFALEGTRITFVLKAPRGEALRPVFTGLDTPLSGDALANARVTTNRRRTATRIVRFRCPDSGTYVLGIGGTDDTTGRYVLSSVSRPAATVLSGADAAIADAEQSNVHVFDADAGSIVTLIASRPRRGKLRPRVVGVDGPDGALDLSGLRRRRTTRARDLLPRMALTANGTYRVEVAGDLATTGDYRLLLKPTRRPRLDFDVDPAGARAPLITSVSPSAFDAPSVGNTLTVLGDHFVNGATVSFTSPAGITSVLTTFESATELTVAFAVEAGAAAGSRSLTVTNPDARSATKPSAITLSSASSATVIDGVVPPTGPPAGGTRVTLVGRQFSPGSPRVTFGGVDAYAISVVDANHVLCTVPAAATASRSGGTAVTVTVDYGAGVGASLPGGFLYERDQTGPTVVAVAPISGSAGAATNLQRMVYVLSEPAAPATVVPTLFNFFRSVASGPNDLTGAGVAAVALGPSGRTVVISRTAVNGLGNNFPNLSTTSVYVASVPNTVTDLAGNALDVRPFAGMFFQGNFTTGTVTDVTAPAVTAVTPATAAVGVPVDSSVTVTFSEPVDPVSVAAAVTLSRGATVVPVSISMDALVTTATLTPRHLLAANSGYTIGVSTALTDLAGLPIAGAFASGFSTNASDGVAPTTSISVNALPADMNGSGTYVPGFTGSGAGPPTAYDVLTPQDGFTVDVTLNDVGGSGVDVTTFTLTCDRALGGIAPGTNLASLSTVTPLRARFEILAANATAAGANMTFTVNASDVSGNAAAPRSLTVDVADRTQTITNAAGTPATDRDPLNARQTWLLRLDLDVYGISAVDVGSGVIRVDSVAGSNGVPDYEEDLRLLGLNGTESGAAATVTNGADTGTNAIVRTLVADALRGYLDERFVVGGVSADIEFLLAGESGSLASAPDPTQWTTASGYSILSLTGDEQPGAGPTITTLGRATVNLRNTAEENESNAGSAVVQNSGVFATNMVRRRINDASSTLFPQTFDPLIPIASRGGTPVGSHARDGTVLAGAFDYAAASQSDKDRFDAISLAIDRWALYLSFVAAHEIGHALGLVANGPPPFGLFGDAHVNNTFIVNGGFTSPDHIDTPGDNLMESASSFATAVSSANAFVRFGPMNGAYLLRRLLYDQ